ncbi:GLPGLI family protein [Winogradskyella echinorum]|uniref:GLPGLI family protein n=1 Tax=Winogradskyella echinorum TaxID=538189 RepID=A0ABR6Y3W4_9FLAO|nr:GLPGLI family protein [Winogradskyella echinorum]MBC3847437.1 GLPGLI family protein [Winogradskyella echinorum]MBC5751785.1 GLPGLI family protein [Winogradskyella echinorum]
MNKYKTHLVIMLLLITITTSAQDFQGVATYKTQRKIDIKMDSTQVNNEMQTKMIEMMKKQFQKTYNLTFNKEESLYKEEVSLDKPQTGMGGEFQIVSFGGGGGTDVLYKNTKDQRYADHKDTMGKLFLVKDDLEKIDWKLEADTKYIGEYQCYKATYTKMVEKPRSFSNSVTTIKDEEEKGEDKEPEMIERTVTAWYTPQVPVNNGPAMYQGLPGLILEIHDGKLTIICSKIVLNPEEKISIEEPTKGKTVNQKKYDEIMEKKTKEMMERYAPRKGSRNGESIEIRIGG